MHQNDAPKKTQKKNFVPKSENCVKKSYGLKGQSHQIRLTQKWYHWRDLKEQPWRLMIKFLFKPLKIAKNH